jgi:hypothetical protein
MIETRDIAVDGGLHVVKFYEHDAELVEAAAPYLAAAIRAGEVAIVIATDAHRRAFETALGADGIDLVRASADGTLVSLDAATTMSAFVNEGEVDGDGFDEVVGGLVRSAAATGRPVRAYGEMVALLWEAGDVLAAIELETLWNELGRELAFSLFCSYPAAAVAGSEHTQALQHVCHLHASVLSPSADEHASGPPTACAQTGISADFPREADSPGRARRLIVEALRRWGAGDALVDDVALIVSELATNAVRHARSSFSVTVRAHGPTLRVAVQDGAPLDVTAPRGGLIPQRLHGLSLVELVSADWGIAGTQDEDGKVVWAELPYD